MNINKDTTDQAEGNKKSIPMEEKEIGRRDFFRNLGLLGVGALTAPSVLLSSCESKGSKIKVLGPNNQLMEVDSASLKPTDKVYYADEMNKHGRQGIPGKKFVMVIDLSKCRNARECMKICQHKHQLRPDQYHLNVLKMKNSEFSSDYFMPKQCQHCDNPPCVKVCPVEATFKRTDGIVLVDNERCIGCRFCIAACPYSARTFNWFDPIDAEKYKDVAYDMELNVPQKKGTVSKCTFSADCLRDGKLPYCVTACPNGVYYFGNVHEDTVTNGTTGESVVLSTLLTENAAYRLMEDLGTMPSVFYLPPKDRPMEENTNKENA